MLVVLAGGHELGPPIRACQTTRYCIHDASQNNRCPVSAKAALLAIPHLRGASSCETGGRRTGLTGCGRCGFGCTVCARAADDPPPPLHHTRLRHAHLVAGFRVGQAEVLNQFPDELVRDIRAASRASATTCHVHSGKPPPHRLGIDAQRVADLSGRHVLLVERDRATPAICHSSISSWHTNFVPGRRPSAASEVERGMSPAMESRSAENFTPAMGAKARRAHLTRSSPSPQIIEPAHEQVAQHLVRSVPAPAWKYRRLATQSDRFPAARGSHWLRRVSAQYRVCTHRRSCHG